jgi:hypothetical protein
MNAAEYDDSPTVWFALLERAIRANDTELRLRAETKLRELGVSVSFSRPATRPRHKQEGTHNAR